MKRIILSNCSNRKSSRVNNILSGKKLKKGTTDEVVKRWIEALKNHDEFVYAKDFYQGRSIQEAKKAAHLINAEQYIISAGIGLISIDEKIPTYNLTVTAQSAESIQNKIKDFEPSNWWKGINQKRKIKSIKQLVNLNKNSLIIIAVNTNYYKLIEKDLLGIEENEKQKLRIIGPITSKVHSDLKEFIMPYDERFDSTESPIQGTKTDFPQRATHHFCELIKFQKSEGTLSNHKKLVEKALEKLKPRVIPTREKRNNDEIIELIKRNWKKAKGQSGKMLRIIRDDENVACEQGRFKDLFNSIRNQKV